ncbi:MAG: putative transcription factor, like protein [Clostridium sp.]|nr:putative transcription factor, like protein [Clostridium sp.]
MSYIYVETHSTAYRIKEIRLQKNLSIKELSSLSNISYNYITALESGRYIPSFKVLNKLSKVLDVPIWYLGYFENIKEDSPQNKFKKARYYHGHTRKDVAIELGLNEHTIKDWEEKVFNPLNIYLEKIKAYMDILNK